MTIQTPKNEDPNRSNGFRFKRMLVLIGTLPLVGVLSFCLAHTARTLGNTSSEQLFADSTGLLGTLSTTGSIDLPIHSSRAWEPTGVPVPPVT